MSDKSIADIGRKLADALSWYARSRSDESRKEIARLHTELCLSWQDELRTTTVEQEEPALPPVG